MVGDRADQAVLAGLEVDRRLAGLAREEGLGRLAVVLLLLVAQRALELHDGEVVGQAAALRATRVIAPGAHLDVLGQRRGTRRGAPRRGGRARACSATSAPQPPTGEGGQRDEEQRDTSARHDLTYDARPHGPTPSCHRRRARRGRRRSRRPAARRGSPRRSPPQPENVQHGAQLFSERCSGCHTLDVAGAQGTTRQRPRARARRRPELQHAQGDGRQRPLRDPQRRLLRARSCPRTSSSGKDAEDVADFLAKYSGSKYAAAERRRARPQADPPRPRRRCAPRWRAARDAGRRASTSCSSSTRAGARRRRRPRRLRAEQNAASEGDRRGQAGRRGRRATRSPRCRSVSRAGQGAARGAARGVRGASCRRSLVTLPNLPDPTAADEDDGRCARSARPARPARDHLELAGELIDMERGARAVGLALRLPARRPRAARAGARALGAGEARAATASSRSSRPCSCARRRCTAPASCPTPSSRSTACPTTTCTSSGRARSRWPRCTPARSSTAAPAAALRRLLAVLPARGGRRGQGHARHLPRAPVRQGRDVLRSSSPDASRDEHERLLGDRGGDPAGARDPLPRGQHRASTTSARRAAKKYDCEAWLPGQERYRELTSTLEHDRLPGAPAATSATARGRRRGPRSCTRSTAPRSPSARTMIALLENGQREDGSVALPEVLVRLRRAAG